MSKQKEQKKNYNRMAVFANVPQGKDFWAANGLVIKNLYELANSFEVMDDYTFSQHVNQDKNDFAKWTNDVLNQQKLAEQLGSSKSLAEHQVITLKHMVNLLK